MGTERPARSAGFLFRVEAPVYEWDGRRLLRVSIGPYNDEADVDRLIAALGAVL